MRKSPIPTLQPDTQRSPCGLLAACLFTIALFVTPSMAFDENLINNLKSELKIDAKQLRASEATQTIYVESNEECALINCYKHLVAIHKDQSRYFVSVLGSKIAIPFKDRYENDNGGKTAAKKTKVAIARAITVSDSTATVTNDNENDDEVDYTTQFRYNVAYGANIELVREPKVAVRILYQSFDHILKNGFGNLPKLDTIPAGGIIRIMDHFCGTGKEKRVFDFFAVTPEFNKFGDIDTTTIIRPKVAMTRGRTGVRTCEEFSTYYVFINKKPNNNFRFVLMGKADGFPDPQIFDWRITQNLSVFGAPSK